MTFYDSQAVTMQSCTSAVGLLLHGLAGPATGARGREQGGGRGDLGGKPWCKPMHHLTVLARPFLGSCNFADNSC